MDESNRIITKLRNSLKSHGERFRNIISAYRKMVFSGRRLPPGDFSRFDQLAPKDQRFLLKRFAKYGEIFKVSWNEKILICVVGLDTSRQLLNKHTDKLKSINIELRHIFPEGFMRNMRGETHRKYRNQFTGALKFDINGSNQRWLGDYISKSLSDLSESSTRHPNAKPYTDTLNTITAGLLLRIFFGVEFGSVKFMSLLEKYNRLGPDGFVWQVGDLQREIYVDIADQVKELAVEISKSNPKPNSSVLSKLIDQGPIDETIIGNIIYMVELGRFDMYSLFRWLTKFLVDNPEIGLAISESVDLKIAEAFVQETLRMEQSEGLIREATEDFVFDGYLIPKGAALRFCLWEPHKFKDPFSDPFEFDPSRFLEKSYSIEQYAPFGLDQHRCPAGDMAIALSSLFISVLTREFEIECLDDGPPFRGVYHWQPNENFAIRLRKKSGNTTRRKDSVQHKS